MKQKRREYKLTQADLARLMGVKPNTVARWERGDIPMNQALVSLAFEVLELRRELGRNT